MRDADRADAGDGTRAVAERAVKERPDAVLVLGILNIAIAVLVGTVIWFRAGFIHFGMVDQLSHKLDSGEIVIEGVNEQGGEGGGGHGDYFHDAVDLTDELLGSATGEIMVAALLGAAGQGAIGIGLFVCWWRAGRAVRVLQSRPPSDSA